MHFDILFVMRWWIAIGCVLAACSNSGALEVVVEMDPQIAVDRVQLYVGLGSPENQNDDQGQPRRELLVPSGYAYPERPTGFYWKRDPNGAKDVIDVDPGAADARFAFHEGTHDDITLIVVGYHADEVVAATSFVHAQIETGTVSQYHVKLKPASSPLAKPRAAITVHRWGPMPGDTQCAYLEDATTEERGIYVVERDDRDCDGFPDESDKECRADVFQGYRRPKADTTKCIRMDTLPPGNINPAPVACVLGGQGCRDGLDPSMTGCEPSTVCVPPADCAACSARPDAIDCMAKLPTTTAQVTRIECTFFFDAAGALCPGKATLTPRLPSPLACDPLQPFSLWADGGGWKPSTYDKNGVTAMATMPTSTCDLGLAVVAGGNVMQATLPTVLMYPLMNGRYGALPTQIFLKPVTVGTSCDDLINTNRCALEGELMLPSFAQCLMSDVIQPW